MNWLKMTAAACALFLVSGCGAQQAVDEAKNDAEKAADEVKNGAENAAEDIGRSAEKAKEQGEKTLDDMMQYLRDQGIAVEDEQTLDAIEFAAYDGRSFSVDGTQMYLYRIDTNDETMQKVIAQLKQAGSVKVEKDGETLSYSGTLFEDYLLLHDPGADVHVFVETMNHYSGGGVTSNAMRESSTTE